MCINQVSKETASRGLPRGKQVCIECTLCTEITHYTFVGGIPLEDTTGILARHYEPSPPPTLFV